MWGPFLFAKLKAAGVLCWATPHTIELNIKACKTINWRTLISGEKQYSVLLGAGRWWRVGVSSQGQPTTVQVKGSEGC